MASATTSETDRTQNTNQKYPDGYGLYPRKAVLNRIATGECLEDRVYWTVTLLAWCGPGKTCAYACIRDARGFIWRQTPDAEPTPAEYSHLAAVLNLDPKGSKSAISKAITSLRRKGSIRKIGGKLFPVKQPEVSSTDNRKLLVRATFSVGLMSFDAADWVNADTGEPVNEAQMQAGIAAMRRREELWRTYLNAGKHEQRTGAVQDLFSVGILIDKKKKNKLASQPSPDDPPEPAPNPPEPAPIPESAATAPRGEPAPPAPPLAGQAARDDIRAMGARLGFTSVADALCDRIHAALKGAPLEWLEARAAEPKNRRRMDGPGLLESFASDVATKWSVEKRNTAVQEPPKRTELDEKVRLQNRQFAEEVLKDPQSSERDKELAREVLRE